MQIRLNWERWAIVIMAIVVIAFIIYFFVHQKPDVNQAVSKHDLELLQNKLDSLNKKIDVVHDDNQKNKAEIISFYQNDISRTNKNVYKLYKKLDEELDTIHNLNHNDGFDFFTSWVPAKN